MFVPWTACIGNGKTARRLGVESTKDDTKSQRWFLKQLRLRICVHARFFGMLGSCNNLNILKHWSFIIVSRSHQRAIARSEISSKWPWVQQTLSPCEWNISRLGHFSENHFKSSQQQAETVFKSPRIFENRITPSTLQNIGTPCRLWNSQQIRIVILACIILHNMIVEDQKKYRHFRWFFFWQEFQILVVSPARAVPNLSSRYSRLREIQSTHVHASLQRDLIDHICQMQGEDADIGMNSI